jgi:N-ethylmaleimide reductase
MATLFDPVTIGDLKLANRIVMAPLTRNRSPRAVPNDLNVTYYEQRASAGLIITEATPISHQGQGYADVPGLYSDEQLAGWKRVTDAVHSAGGKIVVQMWQYFAQYVAAKWWQAGGAFRDHGQVQDLSGSA